MSRNRFCTIRSSLQFHPPVTSENHYEIASKDPLWHSRAFLNEFFKNCCKMAVPAGCSALDENSAGARARSGCVSYISRMPDKYAVRFYSVVSNTIYCSSMWNNSSGNTTGICRAQRFCGVFPSMRQTYNKGFMYDKVIDSKSPSALWICQLAQQHQNLKDPTVYPE